MAKSGKSSINSGNNSNTSGVAVDLLDPSTSPKVKSKSKLQPKVTDLAGSAPSIKPRKKIYFAASTADRSDFMPLSVSVKNSKKVGKAVATRVEPEAAEKSAARNLAEDYGIFAPVENNSQTQAEESIASQVRRAIEEQSQASELDLALENESKKQRNDSKKFSNTKAAKPSHIDRKNIFNEEKAKLERMVKEAREAQSRLELEEEQAQEVKSPSYSYEVPSDVKSETEAKRISEKKSSSKKTDVAKKVSDESQFTSLISPATEFSVQQDRVWQLVEDISDVNAGYLSKLFELANRGINSRINFIENLLEESAISSGRFLDIKSTSELLELQNELYEDRIEDASDYLSQSLKKLEKYSNNLDAYQSNLRKLITSFFGSF